jgi:Na+/H+-dicarboxylate symporter
MSFVMLLMKIAPIGIFCLVAVQFGQAVEAGKFGETFRSLLFYMLVVVAALCVHFFVVLPLILFFSTRRSPYRFIVQMSEALLTAFSTASSSATLPVSMECAEKRAHVSRRAVEFVLPLGATVNMNGTALYQACAAVFIAQVVGLPLGLLAQLTILLTATLAAVAAAGVPHAGVFTMLIVFNSLGLPLEGIALIFAVDWLLDRFRTTVNVFGDAVGAAVVQNSFRT